MDLLYPIKIHRNIQLIPLKVKIFFIGMIFIFEWYLIGALDYLFLYLLICEILILWSQYLAQSAAFLHFGF